MSLYLVMFYTPVLFVLRLKYFKHMLQYWDLCLQVSEAKVGPILKFVSVGFGPGRVLGNHARNELWPVSARPARLISLGRHGF